MIKVITIGTKLHIISGAMYPEYDAIVVDVDANGLIEVENEIGDVDFVELKDIKQRGETSVNGSPIGVFFGELYA